MVTFSKCQVNDTNPTIGLICTFQNIIFLPIQQPDYHAHNQDHWKMLWGLFHCNIVICLPAIIKSILNCFIGRLLQVKFQPIHCGPDIVEDWIFADICCFALSNLFFGWNCNWCKSIAFQHMNHDMMNKMQIHAQIGHCHAKNQLEIHHRTPSSGPSQK